MVKKLPEPHQHGVKGPSPNSIDYLSRYRKMVQAQKRNAQPTFNTGPLDRGSFLSQQTDIMNQPSDSKDNTPLRRPKD